MKTWKNWHGITLTKKSPVIAFSEEGIDIEDAEDYDTPIIPLICSIFWPIYPQNKNMCNKILFMEHDDTKLVFVFELKFTKN